MATEIDLSLTFTSHKLSNGITECHPNPHDTPKKKKKAILTTIQWALVPYGW